jgi:hypothetical protein
VADSIDVGAIANSILTDAKGVIEAKAVGWLSAHPEVIPFLTKVCAQMAEYMLELILEQDPAKKQDIRDAINDDKDALKEEGLAIIARAEAATPPLFLTIIEDAAKIALGLAPQILKAVPL